MTSWRMGGDEFVVLLPGMHAGLLPRSGWSWLAVASGGQNAARG
jgi:GGDEF domain-containing protein